MSIAAPSRTVLDGRQASRRLQRSSITAPAVSNTCVSDPVTGECAIIDPVLDYDEKSGSLATSSADQLLRYICRPSLEADMDPRHPSACRPFVGRRLPEAENRRADGNWREGRRGSETVEGDLQSAGYVRDGWLAMGPTVRGWRSLPRSASWTSTSCSRPGTRWHRSPMWSGNAAFIHDTLLMPDFGTARCDFPGGRSQAQLWRTIQRILALPDDTRLFTGHDYMPGGRAPAWESTVAEQRSRNVHLQQARNEQEFVELRRTRDAKLPMPKLILHALQVNMAAGRLPAPETNGRRYLRIPLEALPGARWE